MRDGGLSLGLFEGLCPRVPQGFPEGLECAAAGWEGAILVFLAIGVGVGMFVFLRRRAEAERAGPFLVFSPEDSPEDGSRARRGDASPQPAGDFRAPHATGTTPATDRPPASGWGPATERPPGNGRPLATERPPATERRSPPGHSPSPAPRATERMTISPETRKAAAARHATVRGEGGSVVHHSPPEGTLQLLPGSLRIEVGDDAGEEIRFVRIPGEEAVITFGRSTGPPYRHIQLRSPTVSRLHARLTYRGPRWTLRNESATNPTVVNGEVLDGNPAQVVLRDGDRVEMGEIVFVFHQPGGSDRLPLRSSWYTDRGRRPTNQDAVGVRTLPGGRELAVVCDGMGSQVSSGIASHVALDALTKALADGSDLVQAVHEANRAVRRAAEKALQHEGMGTTLVALLREGDGYVVANVGDSRAYRADERGIRQITTDHSFVAEAVGKGTMTLEEASRSPWRNAVTRNLGAEPEVEVDLFGPFDASVPHLAILSTDGVHGVLTDDEMEALVRDTPDVRDLARVLAEAALAKGGEDNVAAAVLDFSLTPEDPE